MNIVNRCLICNERISHSRILCENCEKSVNRGRFDNFMIRCPKCAFPLVSADYVCPHCTEYPDFKVFSVFDYRDSFSKKILERYKFGFDRQYAKLFAQIASQLISNKAIIVPIPSSAKSLKERGWDQMLLVTKHMRNKTVRAIKRNEGDFAEQKELNKEQREAQARKRYSLGCTDGLSPDSEIVIMDDVRTTGSTINAARNILTEAGFSNIWAFTFFAEL